MDMYHLLFHACWYKFYCSHNIWLLWKSTGMSGMWPEGCVAQCWERAHSREIWGTLQVLWWRCHSKNQFWKNMTLTTGLYFDVSLPAFPGHGKNLTPPCPFPIYALQREICNCNQVGFFSKSCFSHVHIFLVCCY